MATLKEVLMDNEVAKALLSHETPEAAQAFLKEKGVEISLENVKEFLDGVKQLKDDKLVDEDLKNVSGGWDSSYWNKVLDKMTS